MISFVKNILCIGAGYVGGPTMAVIAQNCPEYRITIVDIDEKKVQSWQSAKLFLMRNYHFSSRPEKMVDKGIIIRVQLIINCLIGRQRQNKELLANDEWTHN